MTPGHMELTDYGPLLLTHQRLRLSRIFVTLASGLSKLDLRRRANGTFPSLIRQGRSGLFRMTLLLIRPVSLRHSSEVEDRGYGRRVASGLLASGVKLTTGMAAIRRSITTHSRLVLLVRGRSFVSPVVQLGVHLSPWCRLLFLLGTALSYSAIRKSTHGF